MPVLCLQNVNSGLGVRGGQQQQALTGGIRRGSASLWLLKGLWLSLGLPICSEAHGLASMAVFRLLGVSPGGKEY